MTITYRGTYRTATILILMLVFALHTVLATVPSQSALTLLEPAGARPAALAESFTAISNDVTALKYNPSAIATLERGQSSLMYERGLTNDNYGQFLIGMPMQSSSLGFSLAYYTGGTINVFDGLNAHSVQSQEDISAGLTYGKRLGHIDVGTTARYFRSTLADEQNTSAFSGDFGLGFPVAHRLRMGMALQNMGTSLHYGTGTEPLPRIARIGFSYGIPINSIRNTVLFDLPYSFDDKLVHPAIGYELKSGLVSVRAGYRSDRQTDNFTFGAGIDLGGWLLDYAFGFSNQLNSPHRISLSFPFGAGGSSAQSNQTVTTSIAPSPMQPQNYLDVPITTSSLPPSESAHVYIVKEGDTWESISQKFYGRADLGQLILNANRVILINPNELKPGQRLIIPRRFE